jgi:hypothetical protein
VQIMKLLQIPAQLNSLSSHAAIVNINDWT